MIVLRGATSQWKRSRQGELPDRPGAGPPAQMRGMAAGAAATASRSSAGRARASRAVVQLDARAEEARASRQKRITPALMNSPRSTRGTTRTIA